MNVSIKHNEVFVVRLTVEWNSLYAFQVEEDLTVLQLEKNLRCHLETLLKEKSERLRELNELRQQDEELCVTLCATPYYIPSGSMPSHTQLQELRDHIKQLGEEKVNTAMCSFIFFFFTKLLIIIYQLRKSKWLPF